MDFGMSGSDAANRARLLTLANEIATAQSAKGEIASADVPGVVEKIFTALGTIASPGGATAEAPAQPAIPIEESVLPDWIVCLEDGQKLRMLRRHLKAKYNLTPEAYRAKWGLPSDYPMVAPNYAKARSLLAFEIGLGRERSPETETTSSGPVVKRLSKNRRGRPGRKHSDD